MSEKPNTMDKPLDFRFSIPRAPAGPLVELSPEEWEQMLLGRLEEQQTDPTQAMWDLAQFYKLQRRHEQAIGWLHKLMSMLPDGESKASCVLTMGQAMEQVHDYLAAVQYYKEALALEPTDTFTWYFINNNLGFSLNQLGQFAEGERYCRKAIEIDPGRPNGFKNLGLALLGQGKYQDAARCFVTATQVNAADARSFHLLQELIGEHPELAFEFQDEVDCCRKAVEVAAQKVAAAKPVVYRGWRKRLILWQGKLRFLACKMRKVF
jgi:tetratricopeptide (TPR) repeat protein